jgi:geranylgeranyl diphosphate synthase type I
MTSPPSQFPSINYLRDVIEEDLKTTCASLKGYRAESIAEVLSYHLGWTEGSDQNMGKRIRPLLTLLSCSAVGGEWTTALPVSSSIELIHNFSLIHDDIEDGSETRRGMTTVWKRWGIPRAINIGDAVFILARLSAHRMRDHSVPAEIILQLFEILDQACLHLTIGQDMDLTFETREDVTEDEYLKMIEGKTSALLAAATSCGGVVAQANSNLVETLRVFGHHLGLAFQIRDDILGIWGEPEKTGKSSGDDLRTRKKTLPVIYGLSSSSEFKTLWESSEIDLNTIDSMREVLDQAGVRAYAETQSEEHTKIALEVIHSLPDFNPALEQITALASNLVNRQK